MYNKVCPKGQAKIYLLLTRARKHSKNIREVAFSPLDWDILISSFKNIKLSFSNYPCLQVLEVHKYEDIENAIKIKD